MEKRIKLRKALLIATMALLVFVMAACGGKTATPSATPAPADTAAATAAPADTSTPTPAPAGDPMDPNAKHDPIVLKFMWWIPPDNKEFPKIFTAFTKKYPWITVQPIQMGGTKALQENIAAGEPIDVFWNFTLWEGFSQDYIEALDPYIAKDPDFKNYPFKKGILETFQFNGKQYGLSRGNDLHMVFYNKDLLKQYGMDAPKNDWSYDDMRAMGKKATNVADKHYGFGNSSWYYAFAPSTMAVANGHADNLMGMNADNSKSVLDGSNTAALDDMQWWLDLITKDGSVLNAKRAKAAGVTGDLWGQGQAAFMWIVTPVIPGYNSTLKFNWDVAPNPKGTAKQVSFAWNSGMFLAKAGKHKAESWALMKFWAATKEGQKILYDIGGSFPNTEDQEMVDYFNKVPAYAKLNKDAMNYAAKNAMYDPTYGMVGGNFVNDELINPWSFGGKGFEEEVKAQDYFPPAAQKTNADIAAALKQAQKVIDASK